MPEETKPVAKRAKKKAAAKKAVKTPEPPKKTCSNCAFYLKTGKDVPFHRCRRYPKSSQVDPLHWCGEHKEA